MCDRNFMVYTDCTSSNNSTIRSNVYSQQSPLQDASVLKIQKYRHYPTVGVENKETTLNNNLSTDSNVSIMKNHKGADQENNLNNQKRHYFDETETFEYIPRSKKIRKIGLKWPENVEAAFKEAVHLIPKTFIKHMKICGSKYGRNQYISIYIKDRTGVIRTSKQISSHIQLITASERDIELIKILQEGPEETRELCKRFELIFTNILITNPPDVIEIVGKKRKTDRFISKNDLTNMDTSGSVKKLTRPCRNSIKLLVKKFEMSYINFQSIRHSHMFSTLANNGIIETSLSRKLFLNKYPIIARFLELKNNNKNLPNENFLLTNMPIICGDVALTLPPLINDLRSGSYNFSAKISLSSLPREEKVYGLITIITSNSFKIQESFEILDCITHKYKNDVVFTIKIGLEYWKNYVLNKQKQILYNGADDIINSEERFSLEINSLKIQQFVIHYDKQSLNMNNESLKLEYIDASQIRCIFIWEFKKVINQADAITTAKKITLLYDDNVQLSKSDDKYAPMKSRLDSSETNNMNIIYEDANENKVELNNSRRSKPFQISTAANFNKTSLAAVAERQGNIKCGLNNSQLGPSQLHRSFQSQQFQNFPHSSQVFKFPAVMPNISNTINSSPNYITRSDILFDGATNKVTSNLASNLASNLPNFETTFQDGYKEYQACTNTLENSIKEKFHDHSYTNGKASATDNSYQGDIVESFNMTENTGYTSFSTINDKYIEKTYNSNDLSRRNYEDANNDYNNDILEFDVLGSQPPPTTTKEPLQIYPGINPHIKSRYNDKVDVISSMPYKEEDLNEKSEIMSSTPLPIFEIYTNNNITTDGEANFESFLNTCDGFANENVNGQNNGTERYYGYK